MLPTDGGGERTSHAEAAVNQLPSYLCGNSPQTHLGTIPDRLARVEARVGDLTPEMMVFFITSETQPEREPPWFCLQASQQQVWDSA